MTTVRFAYGLKPVFKHGDHDQKTHGNWATGESIDGLQTQAKQFKTFEEFSNAISQQGLRPRMWHIAEDGFKLDPDRKPTNRLGGTSDEAGLFVGDPETWQDYAIDRKTVIEYDMTGLTWTKNPLSDTKADFFTDQSGNQGFFVRPQGFGKLKEIGRFSIEEAISRAAKQQSQMPKSKEEARKIWESLNKVLKHGDHDQKTHGNWATGTVASESIARSVGKKLNYDWYIKEGSTKKSRDAEVVGQLIHEQGWDKPSLGVSRDEFEALAESGDFVRVYRGAPEEALQGLLDGKPWIGNGAAGPGTYVATSRERAQLFASGGRVHEFLIPKKMFDGAMKANEVRDFYSKKTAELGVPKQEWDDAGKFALAASTGNGLLFAYDGEKEDTTYSNFSSDYVVYNTSALIVKLDK